MRKEELKGACIRSRADWLEHGEKPSKFFLNLENKNRMNKNITEIKVEEDKTIKDPKKILQHVQEFYTQLYSNQDREPIEQLDIQPKRLQMTKETDLTAP